MAADEATSPKANTEIGEQGPITETILKLCERIPGEDVELIQNIAAYLHSLKSIQTKEPIFTRTADQVIQSGEQWGCQEAGLVFVTLLRAKEEKASFIQAFLREDLVDYKIGKPNYVRGHVFLRQQTSNGYRVINSTTGEITSELPEKYVFGAEGLDSWDIGLRDGLKDYLLMFEKTKSYLY